MSADKDLDSKLLTKIHGTTLFIGSLQLETYYGEVECYVFQDIVDRKYIFALCSNLNKDVLHTRVHSSCLTSETMLSLDCDCKDQLYGAVEKTLNNGGIMFYLMQSGRGASLISKTRGCQLVQYHQDKITTFDAYKRMGLKDDYRDYRNVKDILIMLDLYKKEFILMTNNPDKIKKLIDLGLNIKQTSHLQFPPNFFNSKYLLSKKETGHLLYYSKEKIKEKIEDDPSIEPFEPYNIPSARRFIHCSSYFLPISPINNRLIMDKNDFNESEPFYEDYEILPNNKLFIKVKPEFKHRLKQYWFKSNIFYDIATQSETIVLEYGDVTKNPVVRFHSEFIFNRFPIKDRSYKERYSKSLISCIRNGSGLIIITNHNGDNASIGKFLLLNNTSLPTGIDEEKDYDSLIKIMKHFTNGSPIKLLYSENSREKTLDALERANVKVIDQFCINTEDSKGHVIMQKRIIKSLSYLKKIDNIEPLIFNEEFKFYVTGIGSSQSHAKFFVNLCNKYNIDAQFINLTNATKLNYKDKVFLIVISQGLSPHGSQPISKRINNKNTKNIILFTSVTFNNPNKEKLQMLKDFEKYGGVIINFPLEDEYSTLIRIIGPLCGYYSIYKFLNFNTVDNYNLIEKLSKSTTPDFSFIKSVSTNENLIIIVEDKIKDYSDNILNKCIEGGFIHTCLVVSESEFSHGFYQFCCGLENANLLSFNCFQNKENKKNNLNKDFNFINIDTNIKGDLDIIEIEHIMNKIILQIIKQKNIDQKNYPGKGNQDYLYLDI